MNKRECEYLKPGRLQDVLTLIQVLGSGQRRTPRQICGDIQDMDDNTVSEERCQHWESVAHAHPEFFRVAGKSTSISLIAWHCSAETEIKRNLDADIVYKLMGTAIELHNKQMQRKQQWSLYVPLIVAGITVIAVSYTHLTLPTNREV